jgi:glycosyltransferase involved in cell wall biosynthesis
MHGIDGTQPWYIPLLDRWAARSTHVAVSVSDAFVDYLIARVHVSPDRVAVVTNGVDTAHFRPGTHSGSVRNPYSLSERDVVIGHVARFSPVKNHAMLIEAFAQVLRTHPHAFLALVGDGPLRAATESRVDTLGIRSRVGFLGQYSDLPEIYRDFDILVLPSFTEATSMSILEGMACGLPVVATEVGGSPHLLADGEAGVLVATDDAGQLSAALIALIDAPKERARLGRVARHRAEKCYTEDLMLDAYESLYMEGRALDESGVRRISFPSG